MPREPEEKMDVEDMDEYADQFQDWCENSGRSGDFRDSVSSDGVRSVKCEFNGGRIRVNEEGRVAAKTLVSHSSRKVSQYTKENYDTIGFGRFGSQLFFEGDGSMTYEKS